MRGVTYSMVTAGLAFGALGEDQIPGTLRLKLHSRHGLAPPLGKRDQKTVEEGIKNEKQSGGYFSSCTVGTPPQEVVLLLDTGSSDTWIPAADAPICSTNFAVNPCPFGSCECEP